jgi:hypothetical protein
LFFFQLLFWHSRLQDVYNKYDILKENINDILYTFKQNLHCKEINFGINPKIKEIGTNSSSEKLDLEKVVKENINKMELLDTTVSVNSASQIRSTTPELFTFSPSPNLFISSKQLPLSFLPLSQNGTSFVSNSSVLSLLHKHLKKLLEERDKLTLRVLENQNKSIAINKKIEKLRRERDEIKKKLEERNDFYKEYCVV